MIPETKFLYLWINFLSVIVPFLFSFGKKVAFYKHFKSLGLAIAITGTFFLVWDVIFTHLGVWGFNEMYISGISLFGLPLGEFLFFVTIPYACIFTYESVKYFVKTDFMGGASKTLSNFLMGFCIAIAAVHYTNLYTFTAFLGAGAIVGFIQYRINPVWLSWFYLSFLFCLVPFFIVNGILTGSGIEEQVVWYNNDENLNIRLGTIPLEDIFYALFLLLMNVSLYEYFKKKWSN